MPDYDAVLAEAIWVSSRDGDPALMDVIDILQDGLVIESFRLPHLDHPDHAKIVARAAGYPIA